MTPQEVMQLCIRLTTMPPHAAVAYGATIGLSRMEIQALRHILGISTPRESAGHYRMMRDKCREMLESGTKPQDAATALGVAEETVYRWVRKGGWDIKVSTQFWTPIKVRRLIAEKSKGRSSSDVAALLGTTTCAVNNAWYRLHHPAPKKGKFERIAEEIKWTPGNH